MGLLFKRTFLCVLILGGLMAVGWCLTIVNHHFGAEAAGAVVIAIPVVVLAVPWWSALVDGNWLPLALVYSWLGICLILHEVGRSLKSLEH